LNVQKSYRNFLNKEDRAMSDQLKEILKNSKYKHDGRSIIACDLSLLKIEPSINTKYSILNDENKEINLGISYTHDVSSSEFKAEFLPRGESFNRKVAFLDRDGILIEDTDYPGKVEDVIFKEDVIPLLQTLIHKKYELIVVTNQSGIARGKYTENDYQETTKYITDYYKSIGFTILDTFYCPYHIDGSITKYKSQSLLRKPMPGMVIKAAEKYQVDLSKSIMIGDKMSDILKCSYLKYFIKNNNEHPDCFKSFEKMTQAILKL